MTLLGALRSLSRFLAGVGSSCTVRTRGGFVGHTPGLSGLSDLSTADPAQGWLFEFPNLEGPEQRQWILLAHNSIASACSLFPATFACL